MGIPSADIKKGCKVMLRNGWRADIMDNMRGNTRMAKVHGYETEMGSVYLHDIVSVINHDTNGGEKFVTVDYTEKTLAFRKKIQAVGY